MRVLLNAASTAGALTGIGHYTSELLRCLRAQAPGAIGHFPGFWGRQARRAWASVRPYLGGRGTSSTGRASWKFSLVGRLRDLDQAMLSASFRAVCRKGSYDVYHEPNFIPLESNLPTVATVHDLSVVLHPEWHPADRVRDFERRFRAGIGRCAHYLTISENGRQEAIRHLGLLPERVTTTYMGVREGLQPLAAEQARAGLKRLGLPERYLLCLGTLEPRKNLLTLLRAYSSLPASLRSRFPLLLVGGWGWGAGEIASYLDRRGRADGALHLGYVPEEHLALLYSGARALAFPSFYEGFGLPPVEMLACGGAVLASTAGAVAETAGAKAHLIDPNDLDGWRSSILRVLTDDDWWLSLRQGATAVALPFSWQRCAADTLAVYHSLAATRAAA
jgi:alpha-1,3-rhamnosyl/mannosyltransferase